MADIIQDVILRVSSDAEDLRKGIAKVDDKVKDTKKQASGLQNAFKSLLPALSATAVVAGMVSIGKAAIDAAAQAEGIEQAFKRFGDSKLLDELRIKTQNLVSDVELQKQAVKFEQFNLPLEDLGNLLAFATQRANDTGESVDFLTNSIVTGLARKSLPILDNLGLNTKEIASEAKKAGDFFKGVGTIVSREMAKASGATETYSQMVQKLQVKWDNAQVALGKFLLKSVGLMKEQQTQQEILKDVNSQLNLNLEVLKKDTLGKAARKKLIEETNAKYGEYLPNLLTEKSTIEDIEKAQKSSNKQLLFKIASLDFEEKRNKIIKEQANVTNFLVGSQINYNKQLEELKKIGATAGQIQAVQDLIKTQEEQEESIDFISEKTQSALDEVEDYYKKFAESLGGTLGDLFGDSGEESGEDFVNGIADGAEKEAKKVDMAKVARELELKFYEDFKKVIEGDAPQLREELERAFMISMAIDTEESIKNVEDWQDANKEIIDETDFKPKIKADEVIEGLDQILKASNDLIQSFGVGEAVQKEIDQLDKLIAKQREVVDSAKINGEQGNADQLALEEERLSQLQAQQDAALKKKEKNAKAEIAINKSLALSQSIVAIASAAKEGASALVLIPLIISALAAGISTVTSLTSSSFFDGTEDTGRGGKLDSRGGFSAILHPNERVMNAKQNKRIKSALGNVSNDDLVNMIENSKGMSIGTNGLLIDSGAINEKMGNKMDEMIQVNRQMLKAMKRNGVNVNIDKNGLSVMMHSMVKRKDIINRL